jgi:hypothetical protein
MQVSGRTDKCYNLVILYTTACPCVRRAQLFYTFTPQQNYIFRPNWTPSACFLVALLKTLRSTLVYLRQYSVWLRTGRPHDRGSIPGRGKRIFRLTSVSRPALRPTQPSVPRGVLSLGVKRGQGVTLITHPHLVPKLCMSRSYISSPPKRLYGVLWDCFTFTLYVMRGLINAYICITQRNDFGKTTRKHPDDDQTGRNM